MLGELKKESKLLSARIYTTILEEIGPKVALSLPILAASAGPIDFVGGGTQPWPRS